MERRPRPGPRTRPASLRPSGSSPPRAATARPAARTAATGSTTSTGLVCGPAPREWLSLFRFSSVLFSFLLPSFPFFSFRFLFSPSLPTLSHLARLPLRLRHPRPLPSSFLPSSVPGRGLGLSAAFWPTERACTGAYTTHAQTRIRREGPPWRSRMRRRRHGSDKSNISTGLTRKPSPSRSAGGGLPPSSATRSCS